MAQVLGVLIIVFIQAVNDGMWLQSTQTALSCMFDRPAGEAHVPACLVAIWKAIALATCAKLFRHMGRLNTCAAAEKQTSTPRDTST